jgi:hypothetical protein
MPWARTASPDARRRPVSAPARRPSAAPPHHAREPSSQAAIAGGRRGSRRRQLQRPVPDPVLSEAAHDPPHELVTAVRIDRAHAVDARKRRMMAICGPDRGIVDAVKIDAICVS